MAKGSSVIAVNRKAYHDYHIQESFEAGIVLKGSEIKSIREGKVNLSDAYAKPENGELWLYNSHIASYDAASKVVQKGLTLVPLKLYIKHGLAKVELGVAKGKKVYDKREAIARRDAEREMERALKYRRR
jgi:SsrA-binding protein